MGPDHCRTMWVVVSSSIRLTTRDSSLCMMELEWNRSDVLAEFRSGKNSLTISGHVVAIQLALRK